MAGAVTYHSDGRPQRIAIAPKLTSPCGDVLRTVLSLTLAESTQLVVADAPDLVFVPLERDMLACMDMHRPDDAVQSNLDGLSPPVVKREVKPQYTRRAMQEKVQGEVWVAAVVSTSGCVSYGRVIRQLHPDLDLEALSAVLHWRFRPAMLADQAVPLRISVAVSFNLK